MLCAIKQKDRRWVGINLLGMVREVLSALVTFYLRSEGRNHVYILGKSTTKGAINTKVLRPDCALIAPEKAIKSVTNA